MLSKLAVRESLYGIMVVRDERLPQRRVPWRTEPLPRFLLPYRGLAGLLMIAVFWPASVFDIEPLAHHSFFPLWLGYILVVDSLVLRRTGSSLLVRCPLAVLGMFIIAIPYWWSFEWINQATQNWRYIGDNQYPQAVGLLITSLHFSIVVPAIFESAEIIGSLGFVRRFAPRSPPGVIPDAVIRRGLAGVPVLGRAAVMAGLFLPADLGVPFPYP